MGICRLCQKEKDLIEKSHILFDFFHSDSYDENHKLRQIDVIALSYGIDRESRPSSDSYEGRILSIICDNETIGKYETYVSNVIKENLGESEKVICKTITNPQQTLSAISFVARRNLNSKRISGSRFRTLQ